MNQNPEQAKIRDAILVAEEFWKEYSNKDKTNLSWKVFVALFTLTKSDPYLEKGDVLECYFEPEEVCSKLDELADKKKGFYDSTRLTKEWKSLSTRLEEISLFNEIAHRLNKNVIPILIKEGTNGGAGQKAKYRFWYKEIHTTHDTTKEKHVVNSVSSVNVGGAQNDYDIEYSVESDTSLPFYARWIDNIDMATGKARYIFLALAALPFFLILLSSLIFLAASLHDRTIINVPHIEDYLTFASIILQSTIYVCVFAFGVFTFVYELIVNNIACLPSYMLPLRLHSAVVMFEYNKPGSSLNRYKQAKIKVFVSKCPICGHRVEVRPTGLVFTRKRKLNGTCIYNPQEHRFSFDFTNSKGKRLNDT